MRKPLRGRFAHFVDTYGGLFLLDAIAWAVGIILALTLRFDFDVSRIHWWWTLSVIGVAVVAQLIGGWAFWIYRSRYEIGSFDEVRALVLNVTAVAFVTWIFAFLVGYGNGVPRSTLVIAAPMTFSIMGVVRYALRTIAERDLKPARAENALLYGSGYLGVQTAKRLMTDKASPFLPVGFLDDDETKRNQQVRGVKVVGTIADLETAVRKTGAKALIVCIGDADAAMLRRVDDRAKKLGLQVMVLPPLDQILANDSIVEEVREMSIEDIIGRNPVRLNTASIASYLEGKRVLVTGAGGSIGSELCRQISTFKPAELVMLDRDETSLQEVQLSIAGHGLLDTNDVVLADIRDTGALEQVFLEHKPEVVFHAAALKHLPMLEQYPEEAWKTNVQGTLNVLNASREAKVHTFVNISTDKAANPTSVLGHSKRVAEKLTGWMAEQTGGRYLSVRFGNVLGSRGSMLPTFRNLIEKGGPLTVTHPDATRFFMTIPEASQLVIQAGGIGRAGEVLILDMGEPVRILDVAQRLIAQSGKDIKINFTGLRHGEKLHEVLTGDGEGDERPFHPKISHASIGVISPDTLDHAGWIKRLNLTHEAEGRVE